MLSKPTQTLRRPKLLSNKQNENSAVDNSRENISRVQIFPLHIKCQMLFGEQMKKGMVRAHPVYGSCLSKIAGPQRPE